MSSAERNAVNAAKRVVKEIDAEIARVRREAEQRVAELRTDRSRWLPIVEPDARRTQPVRRTDSAKIAGPRAIRLVSEHLQKVGDAYQSDVVTATGLNSGTVTHALRALSSAGKVVATGEMRRNSPHVRWIGERLDGEAGPEAAEALQALA